MASSATTVKSSSVAACGVPGTGTSAPSEGGAGVSSEVTYAGGAPSRTWPSWYVKEMTCRRSSGSTWRPRGSLLM
eukprot:15432596-Alexandrium_andersonii.AAC.1